MHTQHDPLAAPWHDAMLAAAMIAVDPDGLGGIHVRARAGPVRERWLALLLRFLPPSAPVRRISASIQEARLSGGLDIGMTVEHGRPMCERGVLAAADQGFVILAMAERLTLQAAGVIGMALDRRVVQVERDGISDHHPASFSLIALDESTSEDEPVAPGLTERLGLRADLDLIAWRDTSAMPPAVETITAARRCLPAVCIADVLTEALCTIAVSAGHRSLRTSIFLTKAARVAAALRGSTTVEIDDVAAALRLVLGLTPGPSENVAEKVPEPEPFDQRQDADADPFPSQESVPAEKVASADMVIAAIAARLPPNLLAAPAGLAPRQRPSSPGKAGAVRCRARRGRAVGVCDAPPAPDARLDVLATLRRAAPYQRLRGDKVAGGAFVPRRQVVICKADFRYLRYREKSGTTAIFAVDASGSAACERLAETKGAIELLLAECYVRRDQVALIAFRGSNAETLLEPTRSLVRAKRTLSALPGGGATPLAGGIVATLALATASRRKGQSVVAVFMTDGRGNVGLDGGTAKQRVNEDTDKASRLFRCAGIRSILIDTGQRPQGRAKALGRDLGAEYLALPRGGSRSIAQEIGARMDG